MADKSQQMTYQKQMADKSQQMTYQNYRQTHASRIMVWTKAKYSFYG